MVDSPGGGRDVRRPLPDEVAERIQAKILAGQLGPGDRLPSERELAEELGVNRSSVREALKKLEQLRLISIHQGSGIRVRALEEASFDLVRDFVLQGGRLDRSWLEDLLELREVLMPAILRVALERSSQAQRDQAVKLLQDATAARLSDHAFIDALRELQIEFARMTGNRVMIMLAHSVGQFVQQLVSPAWQDMLLGDRERFAASLRRLAIAVEAGDAETAERATRDFLRRAGESILRAVDERAAAR